VQQTGSAATTVDDAVAGADVRLALMCLVHLTGDLSWLDEPFRPARDPAEGPRLAAPGPIDEPPQ
jgi:hypothetical protein